ncbi:MAG TPA: hypothetical protein VL860_07710 [Planctomycetota bacterium]|nr:hypothetical protein [Planctomycetota bacterium]
MHRTASLALTLLPKPIKDALPAARAFGARAVVLTAEWGGGFQRPGLIPVDELSGRVLHDFRRALRQSDLTVAAIDIAEPVRGSTGLDRIYALGVRSIELLGELDAARATGTAKGGSRGVLSLELFSGTAPDAEPSTALKELTQLGLHRGVRVVQRTSGPGWADGVRKSAWIDGLGVDLDLPELRRFGQSITGVLDQFRNQILHLRCDDYEVNMKPRQAQGLILPQSVQKPEPESLDELTIFLEHAGYEGAWTLKAVPPAPLGADPMQTLKQALATLQK